MGKRLVANCTTHEKTLVELDFEFLAQKEKDRLESDVRVAKENADMERQRKIRAEMELIAIERLQAKGELPL